jgi:hypothetical protein
MGILDKYIKSPSMALWNERTSLYASYDYHFSGDWLLEKSDSSMTKLLFPLGFNVFFMPVMMHTSFLYGEVPDGSAALVMPEVEVWKDFEKSKSKEASRQAEKMTLFLQSVWEENAGRSKLTQSALASQVYGGTVLGAFYSPEREVDGRIPISILVTEPEYFYPIWMHTDYNDLVKVIISYDITKAQAEAVGMDVKSEIVSYSEEWTKTSYEIKVDDRLMSVYGNSATGRPVAGRIPYVYIPHPPRVEFYGTSLLKDKLQLAKEINTRMVDVGDVIASEAMNIPSMVNVRNAQVKWIDKVKPMLDLGYQQGDRVPDVLYPPSRAVSANSAWEYVSNMLDMARVEAYTPPVIYGTGDGSQRSAASLALQAIPLVAHIREERAEYANGLAAIGKTVLMIAAEKGIAGITPEMARSAKIKTNWYPMLPRDVLEEMTSLINRVQAKVLSPETALEKAGDVLDIQGELGKIREWLNSEKDATTPDDPFKGTGGNGELAGLVSKQGDNNNARSGNSRTSDTNVVTGK